MMPPCPRRSGDTLLLWRQPASVDRTAAGAALSLPCWRGSRILPKFPALSHVSSDKCYLGYVLCAFRSRYLQFCSEFLGRIPLGPPLPPVGSRTQVLFLFFVISDKTFSPGTVHMSGSVCGQRVIVHDQRVVRSGAPLVEVIFPSRSTKTASTPSRVSMNAVPFSTPSARQVVERPSASTA